MFGMFLYLPLFMQGVMGASAAESGSLFTPMVLTLIASSILAGQVIARTRRYKLLAVVASMVSTGAMLLLAGMDASTTRFQLVRNMVLAGMGFGLLQPVYTIAVQNAARREQLGIATASTQFFRSIGSTIGVAVFGSVLLGLYHQGFQALVPPGTPAGVLAPFGNPLQLFQQKAQLQNVFSHLPHGAEVLRKLMFGVHSGLTGALHVIFLLSAGVMALTVILNLMLRETPLLAGAPKLEPTPAE
jgi:MFS family permease